MPGLPFGHLGGGAGVGAALHVPGPKLVAPLQLLLQHSGLLRHVVSPSALHAAYV